MSGRSGWFRPDIQGLRALAVVLILLYHAGVTGFGGGYIGVDVFYVISGFLITRLLLDEFESTSRISLPNFYARRARRILPAAALVLVATVIGAWFLLPPLEVPNVAKDAAASALYVGNYRFAAQATEYLRAEAAPSPLLHYWSLAVEEQFYILWPALLFAAARRGRRFLFRALLVAAILSFVAGVLVTRTHQSWAFFSLPTRAWELLAGAALSFGVLRTLSSRTQVVLGWCGLLIVFAAATRFGAATPYPGVAALAPVAGTAMIIVAGGTTSVAPASVTRLLSIRPAQAVGRISYSLYLWHWPVLTLAAVWLARSPTWAERLLLVGLSVVAATAAYHFFEDPLRRSRALGQRRYALASGAVLPAAVCVIALLVSVVSTSSLGPARAARNSSESEPNIGGELPDAVPDDLTPALVDAKQDVAFEQLFDAGCLSGPYGPVKPRRCTYGSEKSKRTVVLFGDSHAANWFPALEGAAERHRWKLVPLIMNLCPAADYVTWLVSERRPHKECEQWRDAAFTRIEDELRPALVIVASGPRHYPDLATKPTSEKAISAWRRGLERTLTRLTRTSRVAMLADSPGMGKDVPACLSAHLDDVAACSKPLERIRRPTFDIDKEVARAAGAEYVDFTSLVCPDELCYPIRGNVLVFADGNHLTATFAERLAKRVGNTLDPLLRSSE